MNHKFKTTNIRGKAYVEVNQRVLFFRNEKKYQGWAIESECIHLTSESVTIRCTIKDNEGRIISQGLAQEDKTSSKINSTSYVENCETSAVGRALAFMGIGIESSIASSNEVSMAIAKQEAEESDFEKALKWLTANPTQNNYDKLAVKMGSVFTNEEFKKLQAIVELAEKMNK